MTSIAQILTPEFGAPADLSLANGENLYALARVVDDLYFVHLAPEMYQRSKVCANMTKLTTAQSLKSLGLDINTCPNVGDYTRVGAANVTSEELCGDGADGGNSETNTVGTVSTDGKTSVVSTDGAVSTDIFVVTFLNAPVDLGLLTTDMVSSIGQFYELILFAEQFSLDIPYICSNFSYTFWLAGMREKQRDIWRANKILLTNIEQKYYAPKFEQPGAQQPAPYPTGQIVVPKMVNLTKQERPDLITSEQLRDLLTILSRAGAGNMINKIVVTLGSSIQYCDMIFGSSEILSLRFINIPSSLTFYAQRIFYLEELAMYNHKRAGGRFIMDLSAASLLPVYHDKHGLNSPYMSTLAQGVKGEAASLLIPTRFAGERRIAGPAVANERFKVYTNGVLNDLVWTGTVKSCADAADAADTDVMNTPTVPNSHGSDNNSHSSDSHGSPTELTASATTDTTTIPTYRIAFCGSGFAACTIITPLESAFGSFNEYVEEYYPSRSNTLHDIDENHGHDYDTLYDYDSDSSGSDDTMHAIKKSVTGKGKEEADAANTVGTANPSYDYSDIDLAAECDFEHFDAVAGMIYRTVSAGRRCTLERVETENKYKYVITGLHRTIDIFHVENIEAVVVRFHLGYVRGFKIGEKWSVFSSFVTSAMTGINMDMRWSSNRKDPRDTVLKSFQRSFATLLCSQDKMSMVAYINKGADDGTSNWPKHEYVDNGGGFWRAARFRRLPIFAKCAITMIFNPSVSKIGIHQNIKAISQRVNLHSMFLGMRRRDKKHIPDYVLGKGNIALPFMCQSLSQYM